jgi:eukaryotic-like serine/threonine-protein kinase
MPVDTDILPPRYREPELIGRGAMGDIYCATDATLGRPVAIKVLAERYARDDAVRRRFTREALAAARLSGQPHSVTIYDVGEHAGRPYLVMEYLGGGSLDDVLRKEGAQPAQRSFDWLEQAAQALDAAHAAGVVHRDVKPANLMLDRDGSVHVADFGIASAAGTDSLTMTGTVLGTAGYLSPEGAQGARVGPASDRYALGVVAFELLTGRRPFVSDTPTAEAAAHLHAHVPSVATLPGSELPRELDQIFARALAKDPSARYPTAAEFVAALRGAYAHAAGATSFLPPPRRPAARARAWPILAVLLLLGMAGGSLAAYLATRGGGKALAPTRITVLRTVTRASGTTTVQVTTSAASAAAPPASGHALNDAGYAKMQAGDFAGALPLLRRAVAQLRGAGPADPYEAYANYNLGYTLLALGSCAEAIPYLRRALELEPQRHEPRQALRRAERC